MLQSRRYSFNATSLDFRRGLDQQTAICQLGTFQYLAEVVHMDSDQRRQVFSLRLPHSQLEKAKILAEREGISLNHFVSVAVAEKLARMKPPQTSQRGPDTTSQPKP
jgi:HicB family